MMPHFQKKTEGVQGRVFIKECSPRNMGNLVWIVIGACPVCYAGTISFIQMPQSHLEFNSFLPLYYEQQKSVGKWITAVPVSTHYGIQARHLLLSVSLFFCGNTPRLGNNRHCGKIHGHSDDNPLNAPAPVF